MSPSLHELGVAAIGRALAAGAAVEPGNHATSAHPGCGFRTSWALSWPSDPQLSLAQAREADACRARGQAQPLTGVPIAHKDIFVTRALPSTAGSKMLAGYASPFDATVVARLSAAGMVTLGKLNCDEFAMGSANENSAFGAGEEPLGHAARARRLVRRLGGRGGGAAGAGGHRHRHRRLDPPAGQLFRRHRHQADLWRVFALRHDRLRLEPGPGRPAGAQRRGLRLAAVGDERLRRARCHQRRAPAAGLPCRRCCSRAKAPAPHGRCRACASGCRASSSPPRWPPT